MKRILSIISAGVLALLAISCVRDEKVTFKASDVTAPVLGEVVVGATDLTVNYTPAVFDMSFNTKMPVYHSVAIVSVNEVPCNITLTTTAPSDGVAKVKGRNLSMAMKNRGFKADDVVNMGVVIRASIQNPTEGVTNGYVDSKDVKTISWTVADDITVVVPSSLKGYGFFVDVTESTIYKDDIALYAWGDDLSDADDLFGAWPGIAPAGTTKLVPTGTIQLENDTYVYFDLGEVKNSEKVKDKAVNFIINNNNGGSQLEHFDDLKKQKIDHHFFFKIVKDDSGNEVLEAVPLLVLEAPEVDLKDKEFNAVEAGADVWCVIGDAVGGWDEEHEVAMYKLKDDPEIWGINGVVLDAKGMKFRGNHDWGDYDLGKGDGFVKFETAKALPLGKGGGNIDANAGTYSLYIWPTYGVLYIEAE